MPVRKTQGGRWRATLKNGRQYVTSKTFDRKKDAEAWLDREERLLRLGDGFDPRLGKELVRDAVVRWLEARRGTVAEKTLQTDEYLLRLHLPVAIANRSVSAVTARDVENSLAKQARSMSLASVRRYRGTLSSFFAWTVRQGLRIDNPVPAAQMPRRAAKASLEIHPFALEELEAVYEEQRLLNAQLADCVLVLGLTALRLGELKALRVRDYQRLPYPAFTVRRSAPDGVSERDTTKSGKSRLVPIPTRVISIVEAATKGKGANDRLFTTATGNALNGSNIRRDLKWAKTARGRRIHDLRHSAAVLWLQAGVDPRTVQEWLGHSSMRVTEIYAHFMGAPADTVSIAKVNAVAGCAGGAGPSGEQQVESEETR